MENCCCCHEKHHHHKQKKNYNLAIIIISLVSLILSFINLHKITSLAFFHYVNIAWVALVLCGYPIVKSAYKSVFKQRKLSASVLISIAIFASVALEIIVLINGSLGTSHSESYIFAAGEIAFLMKIGGMLEDFTVKKSRAGIERLLKIAPKTALVKTENGFIEIAAENLKEGDIVKINADTVIPADCKIISGVTAVDESAITGESVPKDKAKNDIVFGGTVNTFGTVDAVVVKTASEGIVAKMVSLIEEAEGKKAPISRIANKWAGFIVPLAVVFSLVVFAVSKFVLNVGTLNSLIRGVTILVVFCPCSLALATPTAISAGIGNAAKNGILVKNGASLEELSKIKIFALDKTGTITSGKMQVEQIVCNEKIITKKELLKIAASLEINSQHPIAKSICEEVKDVKLFKTTEIKSLTGAGISGKIGKDLFVICSLKYAAKFKLKNYKQEAENFIDQGKIPVLIIKNNECIGIIILFDSIAPSSPYVIESLNNMGCKTVMLTGDNEQAAKTISLNIKGLEFKAGLLPHEKFKEIEALKTEGKVCMVGDGVNDAPSLAAANCGISIGEGSQIAIETADITLLGGNIKKLPFVKKLSGKVMRTIIFNIILSMSINFAAIILSTFGLLTPVTGAIVHNISSVLVVLNSCLILGYGKKEKQAGNKHFV